MLDAIAGEKLQRDRVVLERSNSPAEEFYRQQQEAQLLGDDDEDEDEDEDDEERDEEREGEGEEAFQIHHPDEVLNVSKRQRPSPADTEDELLETAGVASKRLRED